MISLDYLYDESFQPAMPVVEVSVDGYSGPPLQTLKAIVDSGADGTMLPVDLSQAVDAQYADTVMMHGVLGVGEPVDRYTVAISLSTLTLHGIDAVAVPTGTEGVIGRDVLNHLMLALNGPAHTTQITIDP